MFGLHAQKGARAHRRGISESSICAIERAWCWSRCLDARGIYYVVQSCGLMGLGVGAILIGMQNGLPVSSEHSSVGMRG